MLWCSGLWTNCARASPASGTFPYWPLVIKTICAPSQVMREGRDLSQHGQAARHEQASSSSPVIFHEVLLPVVAAFPEMPNRMMLHRAASETMDVLHEFVFMIISLESLPIQIRM